VNFFLTLENVCIEFSLATLLGLLSCLLAIDLRLCVADLSDWVVFLNLKSILLWRSELIILIQRNAHNFEILLLVPTLEIK
jgi:hypothetical protein